MAVLLGFCSCSYEYEMPDYSNAITLYGKTKFVNEIENIKIENNIKEEYQKYGIEADNFDITEEYAIVKDANGKTLYDGTARGRVNTISKYLELSFVVQHNVKPKGLDYYPGSYRGSYQRSYIIEASPFDVKSSVTNEMLTSPIPRFYVVENRGSFTHTIIEKAQELSYELADAITYVTERNKENVDLLRNDGGSGGRMVIAQMGAEFVVVEIEIYGWPKGGHVNYNKMDKIGTFIFEFKLTEVSNTLDLTAETQYKFVEEPGLATFYNVKNSLPMISKANELGFEFSSWKMFITEKDSRENALTRFEHESVDGMIEAQEGAKSIDVEVEIYGWPKENGRVNYNKKQKIGTFVIKYILISEINNSTLELTDDMQYEFVR